MEVYIQVFNDVIHDISIDEPTQSKYFRIAEDEVLVGLYGAMRGECFQSLGLIVYKGPKMDW